MGLSTISISVEMTGLKPGKFWSTNQAYIHYTTPTADAEYFRDDDKVIAGIFFFLDLW